MWVRGRPVASVPASSASLSRVWILACDGCSETFASLSLWVKSHERIFLYVEGGEEEVEVVVGGGWWWGLGEGGAVAHSFWRFLQSPVYACKKSLGRQRRSVQLRLFPADRNGYEHTTFWPPSWNTPFFPKDATKTQEGARAEKLAGFSSQCCRLQLVHLQSRR